MNIFGHYEQHIAKINNGWRDKKTGLQIVNFKDQPYDCATTYATLGLSEHLLNLPNGKTIRQELLFCSYSDICEKDVASFLLDFAGFLIAYHKGLYRGDIVGPSDFIFLNSEICGLYASIPVIFNDNLAVLNNPNESVVFVWLIPLYKKELAFVHDKGWLAFEVAMEKNNPDLLDIHRASIV